MSSCSLNALAVQTWMLSPVMVDSFEMKFLCWQVNRTRNHCWWREYVDRTFWWQSIAGSSGISEWFVFHTKSEVSIYGIVHDDITEANESYSTTTCFDDKVLISTKSQEPQRSLLPAGTFKLMGTALSTWLIRSGIIYTKNHIMVQL